MKLAAAVKPKEWLKSLNTAACQNAHAFIRSPMDWRMNGSALRRGDLAMLVYLARMRQLLSGAVG